MSKFRFPLLAFLLAVCSTVSFAAQISEAEALEKAQFFYQQRVTSGLRSTPDFKLIYTCKDSTSLLRSASAANYFYIFNVGNDEGFVIVSGEDATKAILGYADEGTFSVKNMPENLKYWLDLYQSEIGYAIQKGLSAATSDSPSEATLRSASTISPLLGNIKWNQSAPYYDLCPTDSKGARCVTGCVATAMAQIMKYHKWPVTGKDSVTYTKSSITTSVNFSKTNYDWNNMLDTYSGSYTGAQDTAVATLMFHCGAAAKMNYTASSSSASVNNAGTGMINYFGYDKNLQLYIRSLHSVSEWVTMIKNELNASRPVLYSGSTGSSAHAFVCDGYDSNDLFHINWGWGGLSNGYFELSSLNPSSAGTGGTIGGYSQNQSILTGIKKDDGINLPTYELSIYQNLVSSVNSLSNISNNTFDMYLSFSNLGISNFSGSVGLGLYQNGTFKQVLKTKSLTLNSYYQYDSLNYSSISVKDVAAGTYQIYCIYKPSTETSNTWTIINSSNKSDNYMNLIITGSTATIQKPSNKPSLALTQILSETGSTYTNKIARFSITVKNSGTEFYSNLALRLDSVTKPSVTQYLDCGIVCIPAGETKTFSIDDTITCSPGSYNAVVVYDSTYNGSTKNYKLMGPTAYSQLPVTVLAEPVAAILSLVGSMALSTDTVYNNEAFSLKASVKNTGGFYDKRLKAYIFKSGEKSSSIYIGPIKAYIETNETQQITLPGTLNLDPGNYFTCLYYYNATNSLVQFPGSLSFKIRDRTTAINNLKSSSLVVYPNPVKDQLNIQTAENIQEAQVSDLYGRTLQSVSNSKVLSLTNLEPGIYFLQIKTDSGIKTIKFIKE